MIRVSIFIVTLKQIVFTIICLVFICNAKCKGIVQPKIQMIRPGLKMFLKIYFVFHSRKSQRFGKTWGWVSYDSSFIWTKITHLSSIGLFILDLQWRLRTALLKWNPENTVVCFFITFGNMWPHWTPKSKLKYSYTPTLPTSCTETMEQCCKKKKTVQNRHTE